MQSEAGHGIKPSSRPPQLQEESGPMRIDQEVQMKTLQQPPILHKKNIPASIGTDGPPKVPVTWMPRPFSWPLQPEVHLTGLTGHSAGRLKLPEDGCPKQDHTGTQKPCFQDYTRQKLNSHGRETEGVCERMDGCNSGSLHVGHNPRASVTIQSEAPLGNTHLHV